MCGKFGEINPGYADFPRTTTSLFEWPETSRPVPLSSLIVAHRRTARLPRARHERRAAVADHEPASAGRVGPAIIISPSACFDGPHDPHRRAAPKSSFGKPRRRGSPVAPAAPPVERCPQCRARGRIGCGRQGRRLGPWRHRGLTLRPLNLGYALPPQRYWQPVVSRRGRTAIYRRQSLVGESDETMTVDSDGKLRRRPGKRASAAIYPALRRWGRGAGGMGLVLPRTARKG